MNDLKICVVGLGYVGLPLAVAFAEKFHVTGFDINISRIQELNNNIDKTLEVEEKLLEKIILEEKKIIRKLNTKEK